MRLLNLLWFLAAFLTSAVFAEDVRQKEEYIPKDLADCIAVLNKEIPKDEQELVRKSNVKESEMHLSLGLSLRNRWGLWGKSRLAQYFNAKGVIHPDNMSGIILHAWVESLKGNKLDEAAIFVDYPVWMKSNVPAISLEDTDVGDCLEFLRNRATAYCRETYEIPNAVVIFCFAYDPLKPRKNINYEASNVPFRRALNSVLEDAGLIYEVVSPFEITIRNAPVKEATNPTEKR